MRTNLEARQPQHQTFGQPLGWTLESPARLRNEDVKSILCDDLASECINIGAVHEYKSNESRNESTEDRINAFTVTQTCDRTRPKLLI